MSARWTWRSAGPQRNVRAENCAQGPDPAERVQRADRRAVYARHPRHLCRMDDVEVSPELISWVTDVVLEELQEWHIGPGLAGGLHRQSAVGARKASAEGLGPAAAYPPIRLPVRGTAPAGVLRRSALCTRRPLPPARRPAAAR